MSAQPLQVVSIQEVTNKKQLLAAVNNISYEHGLHIIRFCGKNTETTYSIPVNTQRYFKEGLEQRKRRMIKRIKEAGNVWH